MKNLKKLCVKLVLLLLPLVLQPAVGFGLSNNTSPFVPIYHKLSPSSHYQHLKTSFHFSSPSFPGSSSSSRPFQFFSEEFFGILSSSILCRRQVGYLPEISPSLSDA